MRSKLILLRHGQSKWNELDLFTGWVDIPLSQKGIEEAIEAGKKIAHIPIDSIFVSTLVRAMMTALLAMAYHSSGKVPMVLHQLGGKLESWGHIYSEETKKMCISVVTAWELNERMYGSLQGLNKQETRKEFGDEQVQRWRRSFAECPPEGESLKMTAERTIPYFKEKIMPELRKGKNVFISAHGNSLRSIMMFLDHLTEDEVVHLELNTGEPVIYTFHKDEWSKDGS